MPRGPVASERAAAPRPLCQGKLAALEAKVASGPETSLEGPEGVCACLGTWEALGQMIKLARGCTKLCYDAEFPGSLFWDKRSRESLFF